MEVQRVHAAALLVDMRGHFVDVFHHLDRVLENVGVDFLEKIGFLGAVGLEIGHLESLVDVAGIDLRDARDLSGQSELPSDFVKVVTEIFVGRCHD